MLRALLLIQQRLDDPLSLEEIARHAGLSPYHFHRIFTGMMGESVKSHIRRLRLERAAGQLKRTRRPVIEVALGAGYESHEAFSRIFKNVFGLSPSEFRSARGCPVQIRTRSGVHFDGDHPIRRFKVARGKIMKVQIKTINSLRVAFMRHKGPYSSCGATWDRLLAWMGKEGWLGGQTQFIGICHDDPEVTPPSRIRYDACVAVDESFVPQNDIGVQIIAGGEYAVTPHIGSYDKLGESYSQLMGQWLPRSGRTLRSTPCFEVYLNSPESTEPDELLTDIYAPLNPHNHQSC